MPTLQAVKTYKHPYLVFVCITVYALSICLMAVNSGSITSANYTVGMALALSSVIFLPLGGFCNCIFFTIPFTAVLKLPFEAFSFITLLQLIYIVRFILSFPKALNYSIGIVLVGLMTQFFPVFFFQQTLSNIILLIANLLTFYCTYQLAKDSKLNINHAYLCFSIGVVLAGYIALIYGIHVAEMQDYRFCGLWTDPNFWGMFCLIGIITCLLNGFQKPLLFFILLPIILGLAYLGFLTLSRTFLVVCFLIVFVTGWTYLKRSLLGSIAVIFILVGAIYYALPYVEIMLSKRGFDENDLSNGRFDNTAMIFNFVKDNIDAVLFGMGYNNTLNVMAQFSFGHGATHNTYADLFLEFGLIVAVIILCIAIKFRHFLNDLLRKLLSLPGIVFCILLFYIATLSMGKYALLYLFAGAYIGNASKISLIK